VVAERRHEALEQRSLRIEHAALEIAAGRARHPGRIEEHAISGTLWEKIAELDLDDRLEPETPCVVASALDGTRIDVCRNDVPRALPRSDEREHARAGADVECAVAVGQSARRAAAAN
jgi:hypothetical protein